ncbi:hypothetical protein PIB30_051470 [Stylosanthes scabra]|uniref:Retrotransposon gag domain-containing protein n=1 Tax=Stylosanthes scabra TaxID=79078 RepID=A0ABU6VIY4_9FABA|nr:hypothetical protein [Stylosanthes scabra]
MEVKVLIPNFSRSPSLTEGSFRLSYLWKYGVVFLCLGHGLKCADDLSYWFLRARIGGAGILENNSQYSSDSDIDFEFLTSSDIGTSIMGDVQRLTLKQLGGVSAAMENQLTRYPKLNANFELKEDPIKNPKDLVVICLTIRRTGVDEDAVKAFTLPCSLEGKAKKWYHTLPSKVTADWALFRKKVLREVFSAFKNQRNSKRDL